MYLHLIFIVSSSLTKLSQMSLPSSFDPALSLFYNKIGHISLIIFNKINERLFFNQHSKKATIKRS